MYQTHLRVRRAGFNMTRPVDAIVTMEAAGSRACGRFFVSFGGQRGGSTNLACASALVSTAVAAAQSAMPSIAASRRTIADKISTGAAELCTSAAVPNFFHQLDGRDRVTYLAARIVLLTAEEWEWDGKAVAAHLAHNF